MLLTYAALLAGTILTLAGHILSGRLVGLGLTALWSTGMAYFLMPPAFSLRVSRWSDIAALVLYGIVGLVFARTVPSKRRVAELEQYIAGLRSSPHVHTDLRMALKELSSSPLALQLRTIPIDACSDTIRLAHGEVVRVLSDIFAAALYDPHVRRMSLGVSHCPGVELLVVTAHRLWPPPLRERITIGKRQEDCERAEFPGWPSHLHAAWFDNGYDRIYQISVTHEDALN